MKRLVGGFWVELPEATHSTPAPQKPNESIPIECRAGGTEHKDYVAPEVVEVVAPEKGLSADKPVKNDYTAHKPLRKRKNAPKPLGRPQDAPLEVRMRNAGTPPIVEPEPYVHGLDSHVSRNSNPPSVDVEKAPVRPCTHSTPIIPKRKDDGPGRVNPIPEPVTVEIKLPHERGIENDKPLTNVYENIKPPRAKKKKRPEATKRIDSPIETRAKPEEIVIEHKKWERGLDQHENDWKKSVDHSHPAHTHSATHSTPIIPPRKDGPGRVNPPPLPVVVEEKIPSDPRPYDRHTRYESVPIVERALGFQAWQYEKYPVIKILDELTQIVRTQRYHGDPWYNIAMLPLGSLDKYGLNLNGKLYLIPLVLQNRMKEFQGTETQLLLPWTSYPAFKNQCVTDYDNYLDTFTGEVK